jgi:hypothetical protein
MMTALFWACEWMYNWCVFIGLLCRNVCLCSGWDSLQCVVHLRAFDRVVFVTNYQLPITKWPHQSEAPVGAAPPTRSQLRRQRQT